MKTGVVFICWEIQRQGLKCQNFKNHIEKQAEQDNFDQSRR